MSGHDPDASRVAMKHLQQTPTLVRREVLITGGVHGVEHRIAA
jgi:hypothetical protein